MCGIAGIVSKAGIDPDLLVRMGNTLTHRGPDGQGIWIAPDRTAGFAHRRLSVIDMSAAGSQPMGTSDGRYQIVFNGEIYNYRELREELSGLGVSFRSASDTEVLLEAYRAWGTDCLTRLDGMFAFAIWDDAEKTLFVARDAAGEKPLKYFWDGKIFAFASEVKALLALPFVSRAIDPQAIDSALSLRFVPSPSTGFLHIKKLPAGQYCVLKGVDLMVCSYAPPFDPQPDISRNISEFASEAWRLFAESTKRRLVSDVPIGAFLSGGLDSTSVVAAMREVSTDEIDTYTVSIGGNNDDLAYAARAAQFLGTRHHEIVLGSLDYPELVRAYAAAYDEPFFDQSGLPFIAISREMKKNATVVLGGDGGDELFGGYPAYDFAGVMARYARIPSLFRRVLPYALLPFSRQWAYRAEVMAQDFHAAYADRFSVWQSALPITHRYLTKADLYLPNFKSAIDAHSTADLFRSWFGDMRSGAVSAAMRADMAGRLPDGYLMKSDIASMSVGLEVRSPFLSRPLVELAARIPHSMKIRGGEYKVVWKEAVRGKIPDEVLTRPKAGFVLPLRALLRNELRPLARETLLSGDACIRQFFNPEVLAALWHDEENGRADYSNHIWSLIALESWLITWNTH